LDLTTATDLLTHDLVLEGCREIVRQSRMPKVWADILFDLVGSYEMQCEDGDTVLTGQGILMGCPVSWPLLCAYTLFLHRSSGSDRWFAVVGDDYVGCHTHRTNERLTRTVVASGGVLAPSKDLLSPLGVGVLAEELLIVQRRRTDKTVSVRAFSGQPKGSDPAWTLGPSMVRASEGVLNKAALYDYCKRNFSDIYSSFRSVGIDPCAPRWALGAGFPGYPLPESVRVARSLVAQSPVQVLKWQVQIASAWSTSAIDKRLRAIADTEVGDALKEFVVPVVYPDGEPVSEILSRYMGSRAFAYTLAFGRVAARPLSFGQMVRRLRAVRVSVLGRSYWLDRQEVVRRPDLIERLLLTKEPRWSYSPLVEARALVVRVTPGGYEDHFSGKRPRGRK